jgi:hypothetical protein
MSVSQPYAHIFRSSREIDDIDLVSSDHRTQDPISGYI